MKPETTRLDSLRYDIYQQKELKMTPENQFESDLLQKIGLFHTKREWYDAHY